MTMNEKYLKVLKTFENPVTIREWAEKFTEMYPDDFKVMENQAQNQKTKTSGLRELIKKISSAINNNKNWSNIISIDKSKKIKKIKYCQEEERGKVLYSKKVKDEKSVPFATLMSALKHVDTKNLPHRDNPKYIRIEQIKIHEFNNCIIFEMAIRNKNVIEISNKLDYIENLMDKYPYLDNEILFTITADNKDSLLMKKKCIDIAKYSLSDFKDELDFTIDTVYSKNYNENYFENMKKDKIYKDDNFFDEPDESIINKYKFKNIDGKTTLALDALTYDKLNIMIKYLHNKLKKKYFVFPNDYLFDDDLSCRNKINDKRLKSNKILESKEILKDIEKAIIDFRTLRPTDMQQIADLFFIYDYNKRRKKNNDSIFITQDIKLILTKYHGIKIEGIEERLTYDECIERYEEFQNLEASFCIVEKSITSKIELMEAFIDKKFYKYLLLN